MKNVIVRTLTQQYSILIGRGLIDRAGTLIKRLPPFGEIMVVTQACLEPHLKRLLKSLRGAGFTVYVHDVPSGETAKSERELFRLYRALTKSGIDRRGLVVALGGGVVGDLSGFAASTYLRGIGFVNIPTTLLAQVDSAIGGKTGINLPEGKNLVGTFYQPKLVISDTATLATLPEREFISSLAEVVKYGVIRSPQLFAFLEKNGAAILKRKRAALERIIVESAEIKAGVVQRDEFETRGERMILNFGHTFGHGFEQATGYRGLLHGEAVSIGMVCAAYTAKEMKLFSFPDAARLFQLLQKLGLPLRATMAVKTKEILKAMSRDKKKASGQLRFILPLRIGKVEVRSDVPPELVRKAVHWMGGC